VFHPMSDDPADRGLSRRHIMEGIEQSLKRLGMEYVDLYQIHRFDPRVPVEETMEALHDLVRSGKVRYLGASSMYAYQFASMQHVAATHGWTPVVSMQNHYNLIYREEEREMIPFCRRDNVAILPWSPLARGFLTGSRKRGSQDATLRERTDDYAKDLYYQESDYQIVDRLLALALGKEVKPAQIALAWLLRKEGVTAPIIGATQMVQLEEAVQALQVSLSEAEAKFLEELYVPHRVLGHT
jgi:aryl-alcohol dehydrogenase-like predicted oxidoreductase